MTKIVIAGSGVFSYATGKGFLKKGYKGIFVDTNITVVQELNRKEWYIQ